MMHTGARMQLNIGFSRSVPAVGPRDPDAPFRMLICSDLGGRQAASLHEARPLRVDADSLEAVLARLRPTIDLSGIAAGLSVTINSIEDFHPDALYRTVDRFARLRNLRQTLEDPRRVGEVATALGVTTVQMDAPSPPAAAAPADGLPDFERLTGRKPLSGNSAPARDGDAANALVDQWIRQLIGPHWIPDTTDLQRRLREAIDAGIADLMRTVLRQPRLRAIEAAWRGIARLVGVLGADASIEIHLLDAPLPLWRDTLASIGAGATTLGDTAIAQLLCGPGTQGPDGQPWSIVAFDHAFDDSAADVALLAALGSLARRGGAALLAGVDPVVLGCSDAAALSDPERRESRDPGRQALWSALRASDAAASIAVAAPRVLMRQPYGQKSDPVESFLFEEIIDPEDVDSYLWGGAAPLLALLAGAAHVESPRDLQLDRLLRVDDLPAYAYRVEGESRLRACTEVLLPETAAHWMLDQGVMALVARRDAGTVRLLRWQSLSDPPAPLRGPWS